MSSSRNKVGGRAFYQNEPLIVRLQNLIRAYPEGVGIIKELIQNADDAGASRIEIIFDWRTHSSQNLPSPELAELMGPAVLVYNDSQFLDEDFENIKRLGMSGKREILWKTGRFGVGFNAVYHATDYPSFISRNQIVFFDPHGNVIPGATEGEPGRSWLFAEEGWFESEGSFWDYLDFMKIYEPGGLKPQTDFFDGTLFRLPLRTKEQAKRSNICKKTFTWANNIEPILGNLAATGEELLLFLKSIIEVEVREILEDGSSNQLLTIKTQNKDEVEIQREPLLSCLRKNSSNFSEFCRNNSADLPSASYIHKIETKKGEIFHESTWRVVNLIRVDEEGEISETLDKLYEQHQKAVPWAGAAARIFTSTSDETPKPFVGKAYCFLPLPEETGFPIHINGFFDIDESRSKIVTSDQISGDDEIRTTWNRLLVDHVVSHACAILLADLVEDIGKSDPVNFYRYWLVGNVKSEAFQDLPSRVIELLDSLPVIRTAGDNEWIEPSAVYVLDTHWEHLTAPLSLEGIPLPEPPLPDPILQAFKDAELELVTFEPENLRQHLKTEHSLGVAISDAPKPCLRDCNWIISLLRYSLSDGNRDVRGLPLAILSDGTLETFGYSSLGCIYKADLEAQQIFENYPKWFLDQEVEGFLPFRCEGITQMGAQEFVKCLRNILDSEALFHRPWQPDGETIPNTVWLALIYQYLTKFSHSDFNSIVEDLRELPLVPGNDGKLHCGGWASTPLLISSTAPQKTLKALDFFGISLVQAEEPLKNTIVEFFKKHESFVWSLTPSDVLDTLDSLAQNSQLPSYDEDLYVALITYLCQGQLKFNEHRREILRRLRIFPTTTNELVALNDSRVYMSEFEPPSIAGSVKLLRMGIKGYQTWKILFESLGIRFLDHSRFIRECLLEDYASFDKSQQLEALEWIRNNFDTAQNQLRKKGEDSSRLKQQLATTSLIYCTTGQLLSATSIYDPGSQIVRQVLGKNAPMPDMKLTYTEGQEQWLDFFNTLGMRKTPSAQDILKHVDRLIQKAKTEGPEAIADTYLTILYHINEYWEDLKNVKVEGAKAFPEALRERAWLPVAYQDSDLNQYPGSLRPAIRLYRADEGMFINQANLISSQRPLFKINRQPKPEVQKALGFRPVEWQEVMRHFDRLIELWESSTKTCSEENFKRALQRVYRYLSETFLKGKVDLDAKKWVQKRFVTKKCLWHQGQLWQPQYTFLSDVSFFGEGRGRIRIPKNEFSEVYELLGQRLEPDFEDCLSFLYELQAEAKGQTFATKDVDTVIKVLAYIDSHFKQVLRESPPDDFPVLTEDLLLIPATQVLVPDAPWRVDAIKAGGKVKLLHVKVSQSLADLAGSQSLLFDVEERTKGRGIEENKEPQFRDWCRIWQRQLKSTEFEKGLERLIYDTHDVVELSDLSWLGRCRVVPANKILKDLYLDGSLIAEDVQTDYFFDTQSYTFSLRVDSDTMRHYLAECLNNQLGDCALSDLSKLLQILEAEPHNIQRLLDKLRVRPLDEVEQGASLQNEEFEEEIQLFDDEEDEFERYDDSQPLETPDELAEEIDGGKEPTAPVGQSRPFQTTPTAIARSLGTQQATNGSRPTASQHLGSSSRLSPANPASPPSGSRPRSILDLGFGTNTSDGSFDDESEEEDNSDQDFSGEYGRLNRNRSISDFDDDSFDTNGGRQPYQGTRSSSSERNGNRSSNGSSRPRSDASSYIPRPNQGRLRSYVRPESEAEDMPDPDEQYPQGEREKINRAGVDRVLEYERSHDRVPQEMPHTHKGYDIESLNEDNEIRYIEVKSIRGHWGERGVKLTKAQFEEARHQRENYWLYVVERAEEEDFQIFLIQNPAWRVDEFYFDDGWQEVAETDELEEEIS